MNRIKISPLAAEENEQAPKAAAVQRPMDALAGQGRANSSSRSSLFMPMHYEKNYAYPLIVWFHSDGSDDSEIHDIMPRLSMRNYVAVAPESPQVFGSENSQDKASWGQDSRSIQTAHDALIASVDKVKSRLNINSSRIYLAGFGSGATMAFRLAFERPELFAGVLALNGPVPSAATPLGQWDRSRKLPVFWAHCRKSQQFEQQQLCEQLRLLHIAGFSLTLRQYPGEDCISDSLLGDVNRWIMDGVNASPGNHPPQAK